MYEDRYPDGTYRSSNGSDLLLFIFVIMVAALMLVGLNILVGIQGDSARVACASTYTAQPGDTLASIAMTQGVKEEYLYKANPAAFTGVETGMAICLPSQTTARLEAQQVSAFLDEPAAPAAAVPPPTGGYPVLPPAGFNPQPAPSHAVFLPVVQK
jgi:hypothetical protein